MAAVAVVAATGTSAVNRWQHWGSTTAAAEEEGGQGAEEEAVGQEGHQKVVFGRRLLLQHP